MCYAQKGHWPYLADLWSFIPGQFWLQNETSQSFYTILYHINFKISIWILREIYLLFILSIFRVENSIFFFCYLNQKQTQFPSWLPFVLLITEIRRQKICPPMAGDRGEGRRYPQNRTLLTIFVRELRLLKSLKPPGCGYRIWNLIPKCRRKYSMIFYLVLSTLHSRL